MRVTRNRGMGQKATAMFSMGDEEGGRQRSPTGDGNEGTTLRNTSEGGLVIDKLWEGRGRKRKVWIAWEYSDAAK